MMKAKALKHKKLPDTWGYIFDSENPCWSEIHHVHEAPPLFPISATVEALKEHYIKNGKEQVSKQLNDYELVTLNFYEPTKVSYNTEEMIDGEWSAQFTIGVQTFTLNPNGDEKHAKWYVKMLKQAFSNFGI